MKKPALKRVSVGKFTSVNRIGFEPMTCCLAYPLQVSLLPTFQYGICGLDYIFTISGVPRVVSTEPLAGFLGIAIC